MTSILEEISLVKKKKPHMGNWPSDERAGAPGLVLGIQQVLTHPSFQFFCHAWSLSQAVCDAIRTPRAPSFWGWACTILGIFPPLPILSTWPASIFSSWSSICLSRKCISFQTLPRVPSAWCLALPLISVPLGPHVSLSQALCHVCPSL